MPSYIITMISIWNSLSRLIIKGKTIPTSCGLQLIEIDIFIVSFQLFQIFMNVHMCLSIIMFVSLVMKIILLGLFLCENKNIDAFATF